VAVPAAGSADSSSGWAKAALLRLAAIMKLAAIIVIFDTQVLLRWLDRVSKFTHVEDAHRTSRIEVW